MSAEYISSSQEGVSQPMVAVRKKLPRDSRGRFVRKGNQEGTNGSSMVPFSAAQPGRDSYLRSITTNGYQEVTNVGSEVHGSTPAIGFYCPFFASNEGGVNVGEVAYGSEAPSNTPAMGFYLPFAATCEHDENIGEAASGRKVPISNPVEDFCWPVIATNDEEANIGEVAYDSILNLESPDPTTLLRIMMGNKYSTDKVSKQFQNVARLKAPDFATLLTVMNNAGYGEAADDGHYDVDKVLTKLEGW